MNSIREVTDRQWRTIPGYREKWRSIAMATSTVQRDRVETALRRLLHELRLRPPEACLYYCSPAAAWADFNSWFPGIGRCLVALWPYQLPLFDPCSFWRKFGNGRETIDLALHRTAKPGLAWTLHPEPIDKPGATLHPAVNREIWNAFDRILDVDWGWRTVRDVSAAFPEEHEQMMEQSDREDPSNPMDEAEYIYLGPFQWLIQELACADFCREQLGARTNTALYGSLTELVRYGSLLLTFERLCIVCERPASLLDGAAVARYSDGYVVRNTSIR